MTYAMKAALGGSLLLTASLVVSANRTTPVVSLEPEAVATEIALADLNNQDIPQDILELLTSPEEDIRAWIDEFDTNTSTFGVDKTRFAAILTESQVVPSTGVRAYGIALGWFRPGGPRLNYAVRMFGLNLKRQNRTDGKDITAVHLHVAPAGSNGQHTLNIFGMPSEDDHDARFYYPLNMVTGSWDDDDAHTHTEDPGDTKPISDFLGELQSDGLYFQLHTVDVPTGAIRGQLLGLY
jgi:hypothetical protein